MLARENVGASKGKSKKSCEKSLGTRSERTREVYDIRIMEVLANEVVFGYLKDDILCAVVE